MRILLVAILFMGMCKAVMACDSMKDCVDVIHRSYADGRLVLGDRVQGQLAIAYAIEDLAKAVRESK